VLSEASPAGVGAIFEALRGILHEGHVDRKVQYTIEGLFAVRKTRFAEHPGVIPELDLVEEADKITHTVSLEDEVNGDDGCNLFQYDPNYEQTEAEWDEIKKEILGEEASRINNQPGIVGGEASSEEEEPQEDVDKNKKVSF
jgi:pre-mRNA-splicing factor CWC22